MDDDLKTWNKMVDEYNDLFEKELQLTPKFKELSPGEEVPLFNSDFLEEREGAHKAVEEKRKEMDDFINSRFRNT